MEFTASQIKLLPRHYDRLPAFRAYFQTGVPILTYHAITHPPGQTTFRGLFYPPARFAEQLAELRRAGFQSVLPRQSLSTDAKGPPAIALTFDDGFRNLCEHALTPLAENQCTGVVYLVGDFIGKTNAWDASLGVASCPLMNETEVREWLAAGHQIGSHTLTHPQLTQLPENRAREEICGSKKKLEDRFGREISDFCYPYGDWNERVRDYVAEAGYRTACTTRYGINLPGTDPYSLFRITVRPPTRSWKTFRNWMTREYLRSAGKFPG